MKIKILGPPLAKQSMRITRKGFTYRDPKVESWTAQARAQLITQLPKGFKPFTEPLEIHNLLFVFPLLKNLPKYKLKLIEEGKVYAKRTKPDLDNLQKGFLDMCQGVLFIDDAQVVSITKLSKIYGEIPRIEFEIIAFGGDVL